MDDIIHKMNTKWAIIGWKFHQTPRGSRGRFTGFQEVGFMNRYCKDYMLSENVWFSFPISSNNWEKLRCHACWQTDGRTEVESSAVFCLSSCDIELCLPKQTSHSLCAELVSEKFVFSFHCLSYKYTIWNKMLQKNLDENFFRSERF